MWLAVLAFLGGALTIVSPCILPVLPFVFARSEQSFLKNTLPLLIGMAVTFAAIATLAAVGGSWAVRLNSYGRIAALVLLALFGLALLSTRLADWISRPFVGLGNRLVASTGERQTTGNTQVVQSVVLGIATGFLWAPCAGPILGLILTGAAINGANTQTTLLLFAYAAGAIASLALATLAGGRIFAALKRSLGAGEWIRRGLGVAVLLAVVAIGLGWDTGALTQLSFNSTNRIEQSLLDAMPAATDQAAQNQNGGMMMSGGDKMSGSMTGNMTGTMAMSGASHAGGLPIEGEMPALSGATSWLNSPPLTTESLRGKVVLIDFWTYSCINCLRTLPFIESWYARYKDAGLVVIGVHSPEFAFEKSLDNVHRAVKDLKVAYPVALDNDYAIWQAFNNRYWPAHYFVDANGQIRGHHFGEGGYEESEQLIRTLLEEAGHKDLPPRAGEIAGAGVQAAPDEDHVGSPETYVGYERAENFASNGGAAKDSAKTYEIPPKLSLNQWALSGNWTVNPQDAVSGSTGGKIAFRFSARDLHLVLGPGADSKPIRFRVTLDGREPGADHGVDTDEHGMGTVTGQRLYQLIRQSGGVGQHTFTIEFLDAGARAYAFTFG